MMRIIRSRSLGWLCIFTVALLFLLSCGSRRRLPPPTPDETIEQSIYGQWNCINVQTPAGRDLGIPYNLLDQNEQGFEFRQDGVYMPRYFDGQSNAYTTNYNIIRYWEVKEEKFLYFSDRPNETEEPDFTWEILQLTRQDFRLKDHEGNTVVLRRQGI